MYRRDEPDEPPDEDALETMLVYDNLPARKRLLLRYRKDPHGLADEMLRKGMMGIREARKLKFPIMPITMKNRRKNRSKSLGLLKNAGGGQSENKNKKKSRRENPFKS